MAKEIKEAGLYALSNSRVSIGLYPKFTWSIKGMCGVLCAGFGGSTLYCGYKSNGRGAFFSFIGALMSGYSYVKLDERDIKAQERHAKVLGATKQSSPNGLSVAPSTVTLKDSTDSVTSCHGRSSAELFNRSRTDNSTWIVEGFMKLGMVNLLVAGGGVGKSIIMVQIALAVAKGTRPEFLPEDCSVSIRQSVKYYRLEDFGDELEGKYGNGKVLHNSSIEWFLPEDLPSSTLVDFVEHIKALADSLTEDTVVFIDPATKLDGYKHIEFIKGVEEAMTIAKARNVTLTIIGTVHLDEIKDWSLLTNCDIKGGDKGLQQAGSVTALRRERTNVEEYRFLQCLKEPKGSPKPFNGDVLVMRKVHEQLDDSNKYLHFEFDSIKPEVQARPEKPKAQPSVETFSVVAPIRKAPNQKVTPDVELIIMEGNTQGLSAKDIKKEVKKKTHINISEKTISRHIRRVTNQSMIQEIV